MRVVGDYDDLRSAGVCVSVAAAPTGWQADRRDEAGLYRGFRLHAARDWAAATHPDDPNILEEQFLTASEAAEETALRTARRRAPDGYGCSLPGWPSSSSPPSPAR